MNFTRISSSDSDKELVENFCKSTPTKPSLQRHPDQGMCLDNDEILESSVSEVSFINDETNLVEMPCDFVLESFIIENKTNLVEMPDDEVLEKFIIEYKD
jgi:hypothetical protein